MEADLWRLGGEPEPRRRKARERREEMSRSAMNPMTAAFTEGIGTPELHEARELLAAETG